MQQEPTAPIDAPSDEVNSAAMEAMSAMLDMAAPQARYRTMLESASVVQPDESMTLSFDRETTEHILRHHELFSSRVDLGLGNVRPLIPLNVDPPQHASFRKLLDPLFAPKRMDEQEEDITSRVNALIDQFIDQGTCNFTEDFAEIFPTSVFLGLMGLPEDELRVFLDLRDGIMHAERVDPDAMFDAEKRTAVMAGTGQKIYEYFGALIDERSARSADDVISGFLTAEIDGERLTRDDILDICFLFLIAGLDTVSDSLTCMYAFLATHPEHRREIAANPACISNAVEELLRWESPVPFSSTRVATQDTTLPDGTKIKEGSSLVVMFGAANVDERFCPAAQDVRFDREANRHIAFGGGVHRCLGSHLARRELRITLREWHRRIPDYWITPGHEELVYPPGLRHVKDLTLSWR